MGGYVRALKLPPCGLSGPRQKGAISRPLQDGTQDDLLENDDLRRDRHVLRSRPPRLLAVVLGMVFATRTRRRRERQGEESRVAPENAHAVAMPRWIEEGRQLLNLWQERVERLDELQGRLAAMATAREVGP